MATRKVSSRKAHPSTKRGRRIAKKKKVVSASKRGGREIQLSKAAQGVEPVIDREREVALLESATKEPC